MNDTIKGNAGQNQTGANAPQGQKPAKAGMFKEADYGPFMATGPSLLPRRRRHAVLVEAGDNGVAAATGAVRTGGRYRVNPGI